MSPSQVNIQQTPTQVPRSLTRLLFAGGCHVTGYPVGKTASFPELLKQNMAASDDLQYSVLSHLKLTNPAKVMAMLKENRPSAIILQLGHFELTLSLRSRPTNAAGSPSEASSEGTPPSPFQSPLSTIQWRVLNAMKWTGHRVLRRSGPDYKTFESNLDSFVGTLAETKTPILLLSPLPCASSYFMSVRRQANPIYQRIALKHGARFVNVLAHSRPGLDLFYDDIHLSAKGHHLLARLIEDCFKASPALLKPAR